MECELTTLVYYLYLVGLSNSESNVIGKAPLNSMCFSGSGGVNRDTTGSLATRVATTLSHEMGHNFGMEHDDGRQCNDCPDENRVSCCLFVYLFVVVVVVIPISTGLCHERILEEPISVSVQFLFQ